MWCLGNGCNLKAGLNAMKITNFFNQKEGSWACIYSAALLYWPWLSHSGDVTVFKGETRFWGRLFQRVFAGLPCMTLHLSKTWSHNLARIGNNLATYMWYTVTVTTNRSHYKKLNKGSKRQQIWRCAKPNVNQCIYYWGHQQLICMMSWGSKSNRKRKWKVGICTCSNFWWPN